MLCMHAVQEGDNVDRLVKVERLARLLQVSRLHAIERQDVVQNLLHHVKTSHEAVDHVAVVHRQRLEQPFSLEVLGGEEGSVERYAHLVKDVRNKLLLRLGCLALKELGSLYGTVLLLEFVSKGEQLPQRAVAGGLATSTCAHLPVVACDG